MKKKPNLLLLIASMAVIISACTKESELIQNGTSLVPDSQYNQDMMAFASAVSEAVRTNEDFRCLIKSEALKKVDGDFDIVFSTIRNNRINCEAKGGSADITIADFISGFLSFDSTKSSSSADYLKELEDRYPELQISVPCHAEMMRPDFIPSVAFIPQDFTVGKNPTVPGIDANGNIIAVDAVNEPDMPIIVIGLNERMAILEENNTPEISSPIAPPSNVSATQTTNGILLSWNPVTSNITSYVIYRKEIDENQYTRIATISSDSTTYHDLALSGSHFYSYYIKTTYLIPLEGYYSVLTSEASNVVNIQAPNVPSNLTFFEACCSGNFVELRWNNDGRYDCNTTIEYQDPSTSSAYNTLTTQPYPVNSYAFDSPVKGQRMVLKASRLNNLGQSDAVYDYIYPPYRNADQLSPVYVINVGVSDVNDVESWIQGAPEYKMNVLGVNASGQTVILQQNIPFDFNERSNYQNFDTKVYDWSYSEHGGWYSCLTFFLYEYDSSATMTIGLSATAGIKGRTELSATLSASTTFNITKGSEQLGNVSTFYYEYPTKHLYLPSYNGRITIADFI